MRTEQLTGQRLERRERREERDIRDHEPGGEVPDSERVACSEKKGIEWEERRVALASGLEQVAVHGDDSVPAAVPGTEQAEQMRPLVTAGERTRAGEMHDRGGRENEQAPPGPPGDDPRAPPELLADCDRPR